MYIYIYIYIYIHIYVLVVEVFNFVNMPMRCFFYMLQDILCAR